MAGGARRDWLWLAAVVSLTLSLTPWGAFVLYPFKLFTTWVHECSHALMTVLTGGVVRGIAIEPDTSGVTQSLMPAGVLARGCVASAGYLGASVIGCLLVAATRVERRSRAILWIVGALMLASLVIWIRNAFGIAVVSAWGIALVALSGQRGRGASGFVLGVLAIQVALDAVYDIRVLFFVHGGQSDADTMARLFLLPSWIWATLWMLASVAMLGWTLWITRIRR
jgi:hypothetical protein